MAEALAENAELKRRNTMFAAGISDLRSVGNGRQRGSAEDEVTEVDCAAREGEEERGDCLAERLGRRQ
jgi:hypothetical protein